MSRIGVVVKGWPRLSETFVAQELAGLEAAGLALVIVSLRRPTDGKRHPVHDEVKAPVLYLPEYLYQEPGRVLRGFLAALRRPAFWRVFGSFLRDWLRDPTPNRGRRFGQAAVLVAEWPAGVARLHAHFIHTPASVADYAARLMGVPLTISAHAKDIWTSKAWDLAGKLARARWTVTCTATGAAHLRGLGGVVHLSYHGLNLDRFPHFDRVPGQGPGTAGVTVLSVGRVVPKKGYDTLLRALAQVPGDWRFVHIGAGSGPLRAVAEGLGIAARCDWQGARDQPQVLAALRGADVFALACRVAEDGDRDGLPNVLVEAASQGLALVTTHVSAIPEVFTDGETALLVPPDDALALAAALTRAVQDAGLRNRLGSAAEAVVRARLDYRASVAQLAALFREA